MGKLALHPGYQLYERRGHPFCSSFQVAETFGKRHDHVMRDIENLDCPEDFRLKNFGETRIKPKDIILNDSFPKLEKVLSVADPDRLNKCFLMTKDGFTFLVMGYRGKKAAAFKIAYINRFNDMEAFIAEQYAMRMEFPQFTEAVMMAHGEPKSYHYSNECDLINRIALGQTAKQFKESRGLAEAKSIRPYLSGIQATDIHALQIADIGLLATGVQFQERKAVLTDYHDRRKVVKLSA